MAPCSVSGCLLFLNLSILRQRLELLSWQQAGFLILGNFESTCCSNKQEKKIRAVLCGCGHRVWCHQGACHTCRGKSDEAAARVSSCLYELQCDYHRLCLPRERVTWGFGTLENMQEPAGTFSLWICPWSNAFWRHKHQCGVPVHEASSWFIFFLLNINYFRAKYVSHEH